MVNLIWIAREIPAIVLVSYLGWRLLKKGGQVALQTVMFFFFFGEFDLYRIVKLTDPVSAARVVHHAGTFWIGDHDSSKIVVLDDRGNLRFRIDNGAGQGPGQFTNARDIMVFPEKDSLLVFGKHGDTHRFKASDGSFIKKMISFMPYQAVLRWEDNRFIVLWGADSTIPHSKHAFVIYFYDGALVEKWKVPQPDWQKRYLYDAPRGYAVGLKKDILIGYMGRPEIRIYPYQKSTPRIWNLHPPRDYDPPPKKTLSREHMFNKIKLREYIQSFSSIDSLHRLEGRYLLVCWRNKHGRPPTADLYDLVQQRRITADLSLPGYIVGCEDKNIFVVEYRDEGPELITLLHIYRLNLDH